MRRRDFLQALAAAPASARPAKQPNIIVMMADDMGYSDLGCYGSEIRTPHIDRLARGGIRFTQFYNAARCCPTRASLLTGLYNHQSGVGHMVNPRDVPAYQGYLNDRCRTIAEVLRPAGYRTYMAGKWHVGEERPHWPTDRGFDRYFGLISGASNYFRLDPGRTMALDDKPFAPPEQGFYMTDAFTSHAIRFLEQHDRAKPFFLYLAFTSPHWPLHALQEDIARYRGRYKTGWDALRRERHARMLKMGLVNARWPLTPRDSTAPAWDETPDKDQRDLAMAVYAAQIDRMDQNVGRLMRQLRTMNAEQDTLILFLADNGGCAEEVHRGEKGAVTGTADSYESYGLPWANASNTPFRLYKHWVHEGGIASPLIAHWPSRIRTPGLIANRPSHLIDIMATCVDVSGARYPSAAIPMEGESFAPLFERAAPASGRALYWEHEGNRAVREGQWKLVSRFPGAWELYDLEADRTELNDLSAKHPDIVRRMSGLYDAWAQRCGVVPWDKLPKPRRA